MITLGQHQRCSLFANDVHLVLVQRESRPRLVAIDQARIQLETFKAGTRRRVVCEFQKHARHAGPGLAAFRVNRVVAVARAIRHLARHAAVRHRHQHADAARRDPM